MKKFLFGVIDNKTDFDFLVVCFQFFVSLIGLKDERKLVFCSPKLIHRKELLTWLNSFLLNGDKKFQPQT